MTDVDVAIVGAGAAGLAAGARLDQAGHRILLLEARERRGGRAYTHVDGSGLAIDLGCHWLHSADRNPWTAIAEASGFAIDRSPPPWGEQALDLAFPPADQEAFGAAYQAFMERLHEAGADGSDRPAAELLEAGNRWNGLIDAVSTYVNGAELPRVSVVDVARYDDSGVNWRVQRGYGTLIDAYGAALPVRFGCPVTRIDRRGTRLRLDTPQGRIAARTAIVTVPTSVLAVGAIAFDPPLPAVMEAAAGLPLGLADKVVLAFDARDLPEDSHLFGRTDRARTGSYHVRPLGRPLIEGYFGGDLARDLEAGGPEAFAAFAIEELAGLVGADIRARLHLVCASAWRADPYAMGAYSHALPGKADLRAVLAGEVEDRLFFAGEAASIHDYSTAHGAFETGVAAARRAMAALAAG